MQLQQSEIINLAVNIFHNVGIKRYIGQMQALFHQEIYFQIYKIIFPDSMINIYKISNKLTTGQKIQKIIQQISSIIKLDLYHISGQEIAKGNLTHLTNWLQLLEALSINCINSQQFDKGGSEPCWDREIDHNFSEDDNYTVQAVPREFEKHRYTDEDVLSPEESSETSSRSEKKDKGFQMQKINKKQKSRKKSEKDDSSKDITVLDPVNDNNNKQVRRKGKGEKRVRFQISQSTQGRKTGAFLNKRTDRRIVNDKRTADTQTDFNLGKVTRQQRSLLQKYGIPVEYEPTPEQKLLIKKKAFITKMNKIKQQIEQKRINDVSIKFQNWWMRAEKEQQLKQIQIQQQNQQRTQIINDRIAQRSQVLQSISDPDPYLGQIKKIFKKQKQNEKKMRQIIMKEERDQALKLMDLNFATEFQNLVMASIGE